jgi:predicted O-linked N-acetylglucosamine transferase (SPINDLY family)
LAQDGGPGANGGAADALLAAAMQAQRRGRPDQAFALLSQAISAAPGHPEANHQFGLLLYRAGRLAEAVEQLQAAVRIAPQNAVYRANLGVVLNAAGRPAEAVQAYESALEIDSFLAGIRANLGVSLLALGRVEDAIAAQRAAIASDPNHAEAQANLGLALMQAGEPQAAVESYRRAIALRADYANAYQHLARAHATLGQPGEAESAARKAIELLPANAAAHHLLARLLAADDRLAEAIASERKALDLMPDAAAFAALGDLLNRTGDYREAVIAFRKGLSLNDNLPQLHAGLGRAQFQLGGMVRAVESFRCALELDPGNESYRAELAPALVGAGLVAEADAYYRAIVASNPRALAALGALVFTGNYDPGVAPAEQTRRAAAYGAELTRAARENPRQTHEFLLAPHRPLRVGLVSGDFNSHPVTFFLENVLAAIDPTRLDLVAYTTSLKRDDTTARLERSIPTWRNAARLDDAALAAQIAADGIDILVDLAGHTHGARLPVFIRKPAPVQVSWLGYSGTTGLAEIDYVLADAIVAPPEEQALFAEQVWRLPDSYLCYSPPADLPEIAPPPLLANGFVTFGSFNNLNKVNDVTLGLWVRLLAAVPGSRLAFKGGALRRPKAADELRARFADLGGDPDRLLLLPYEEGLAGHLAAYRAVDIGLDPFPYNGTTTTCEALLMGVPVLTLRGDRFIAHVGESILRTVGLPDWIATDPADFVARAAAFAEDLKALAALRQSLRPRFLASPLCDAPRFAKNLEAAFSEMWRLHCAEHGELRRPD